MLEDSKEFKEKNNRRSLGAHLTSTEIFLKYIFPEIKNSLNEFLWIDLYAGEGNLILPILDTIPQEERVDFFKNHIFLFDVQSEMIQKCIEIAKSYKIPIDLAKKNIVQRNSLESFPKFLKSKKYPIFHITNPPYLYLGYIRKHEDTKIHLKYFENENEGYQDLYQIAMINDLRNQIDDLIYIIPANFIFGAAVSNKFRRDFLKYYKILKMYVFETKIFEFTGTNIVIVFFKRKNYPKTEIQEFTGTKFKKLDKTFKREYFLNPKFNYRGGSEFDDFCEKNKSTKLLEVKYYIRKEDVWNNKGNYHVDVIDTSSYVSNEYLKTTLYINEEFSKKVKSNLLYIRTVDTGSYEGRAGLYYIKDNFNVDGIYVSGNTYRTSPIHVFLEPTLSKEEQILLREFFNLILEYYRKRLDSEFLTTYKYSEAEYTRKYLGLTQVRKLIGTYPILSNENSLKTNLIKIIKEENAGNLIAFIKKVNKHPLSIEKLTDWL